MAAASSESNKRTQTLQLLASLGVQLPPKTNLADDALDKRLIQAANAAQYLSSAIPKPPLNPSSLPKWVINPSDPDALAHAMRRQNLEESMNIWAARQQGKLNAIDLYADPLHDLRQTIMSIALAWTKGLECCVVQDKDKEDWAINIRMLGVYKIDDGTPVIVLIYEHLTRKDLHKSMTWYKSVEDRGYSGLPSTYATQLERLLLGRLLAMNSRLLPDDFQPEKDEIEKNFRPSFILPTGPLSFEALAKFNKDHGCVMCDQPSKSHCSQCQSVSYCGKVCQERDWPNHKHMCRSLKGGQWQAVKFRSAPPGADGMFMLQMNKYDEVNKLGRKQPSRASENEPPPNIHGDKLFLIKIQSNPMQMMVYDRSRSFQVFIMKGDQPDVYRQLQEEMMGPRGGHMGMKMYRWAKRASDWELKICLDRSSQQEIKW